MTDEIEKKIIEFTQDYYKLSLRENDKFYIERYVDYRDEFPKSDIKEILQSDNPRDTFNDIICDMDVNCDDWYYEDEFFRKLKSFCEENKVDEDEARNIVYENFNWCYPDSFLNPDVSTMWIINHGDMNYDYTLHNILNYAANYGYCNGFEKKSGLYWLAKQQGKLKELKQAIDGNSPRHYFTSEELISSIRNEIFKKENGRYNSYSYQIRELEECRKYTDKINMLEWFLNRDGENDKFVYNSLVAICEKIEIPTFRYERSNFTSSCITELENCSHYITALQFMVKMPLQDIINIMEKVNKMNEDKENFDEFRPEESKKDYGYITLDKSTMCGLFEPWGDGGSLMEIQLEKDVKLPLKFLRRIITNDKYQECCSVTEDCWQKTIKEIKLNEVA